MADGAMKAEMKYFEEDLQVFDLEEVENVRNKYPQSERMTDIEQIHDALILGIKDYFRKSGFSKAVLGLSGGIDSAVVCALACRALGAENVMTVLMPSKFSSDHSVQDALDLVNTLAVCTKLYRLKMWQKLLTRYWHQPLKACLLTSPKKIFRPAFVASLIWP
jgi:NAD+ synthase (glutamine-hydrolysing)